MLADLGVLLDTEGVGELPPHADPIVLPWIYLGMLPDIDVPDQAVPNNAIALVQMPGLAPLDTMGPGLPIITRPRLQVFTRSDPEDYLAAETMAWSVWRVLLLATGTTINGTFYERIEAVSDPAPYDRDPAQRVVFVTNYQIHREVVG